MKDLISSTCHDCGTKEKSESLMGIKPCGAVDFNLIMSNGCLNLKETKLGIIWYNICQFDESR